MNFADHFRHQLLRIISCGLLSIATAFAVANCAQADGVYDYLPEDALGFVAFQNLEALDAKAQKLAAIFEAPMPAPLTFVKFSTGLSEGLNTKGDAMLALLPSDAPTSIPLPMVLLPVADYAKFAESISGDASGEICRVTIAGEDVLIAKHGNYAMLMNVENRETLEVILELDPQPVAELKPLKLWLTKNDIVVAIMPAGAEVLLKLGNDRLAETRNMFNQRFGDTDTADALTGLQAVFEFYQGILDFVGEEVRLVTWGLAIDEKQNLRLSKRALLNDGGRLSKLESVSADSTSVLKGYADQPFVVAGGGPFPESWAKGLASASSNMIQNMKALYGLEDIKDKDWEELEQSYAAMMNGLKSTSMIMLPGEDGQPLFSNFYGMMTVPDSGKYLQTYQEAFATYNNIMSQSTTFNMEYEITETTVAGKQACELTMDMANMMQDPNVPQLNWMMESMFGEDSKLHYLFVAADPNTMVYGMGGAAQLTPLLSSVEKGETGLAENVEVQITMKQLPAEAPWKAFISPSGCVQWAERFVNEFIGTFTGQTMDFPDFPACPPVGISMHFVDSRVEGDLVLPVETLEAIADYIKTCQKMF